jgi:hypothetical protein
MGTAYLTAPANLSLLCAVLAACCLALAVKLSRHALVLLSALTRIAVALVGAGMAVGAAVVLVAAVAVSR